MQKETLSATDAAFNKAIDKNIAWFFIGFFLLLSLLLGWFAWLAIKTERGVVTTRAYQDGIAYNQTIEKQKAIDALGWRSEIKIEKTAGGPAHARFTLVDKGGKPVVGAQVRLAFIRPTQDGHDVTLTLNETAPGTYTGSTPLAFEGLWEAHISAKAGKNEYQADQRVTLP